MKRLIQIFAVTLIVCFCGGWMLFDFSRRFYVAMAACAFIVAAALSLFLAQDERIGQLEKKVSELETLSDRRDPR